MQFSQISRHFISLRSKKLKPSNSSSGINCIETTFLRVLQIEIAALHPEYGSFYFYRIAAKTLKKG
jgi:hypothetical protein